MRTLPLSLVVFASAARFDLIGTDTDVSCAKKRLEPPPSTPHIAAVSLTSNDTHAHTRLHDTFFQVEHADIGAYVSKLRSHEMLPWADWVTKHLMDTYGSLRGQGSAISRVKETDLVQIKENLG